MIPVHEMTNLANPVHDSHTVAGEGPVVNLSAQTYTPVGNVIF